MYNSNVNQELQTKILSLEQLITQNEARIEQNESDIKNSQPCFVGDPCYEWEGATLEKLPLWGSDNHDFHTFEWPTQETFDLWRPGVSVTSIDFGILDNPRYNRLLASVRVNYSNGQSSPLFQHDDNAYLEGFETITFNPDEPVRSVSAEQYYKHSFYIYDLKFRNSQGEVIDSFNSPGTWPGNIDTFQIRED